MLLEQCQGKCLEQPAYGFWQHIGRLLQRFGKWLEQHAQLSRGRRQLLEMDDHLLKDIGLSRADAERIAGRRWNGWGVRSSPRCGKSAIR